MPRIPHKQKEKRQRCGEKDYRLHSPDPFMNSGKFVADCDDVRQNRKLRSDITWLVPGPINLWIGKMKSVGEIISRDRGDITLSPAPFVDERLINIDKPNRYRDNGDRNRQAYVKIRFGAHYSRLDKAPFQSQSSTSVCSGNGKVWAMKKRFCAVSVLVAIGLAAFMGILASRVPAQAPPPPDAPDVVDYQKLLPLLPDAPSGWTAEKAEGSTSDIGGFKLTNVHRDYKKGEGDNGPTASISILDSAANPEYASVTTEAWKLNSETTDGYTKSVTIEGNPGFESYQKDQKNAALWVMVAKRYFVEIELQNQDPKELQEWIKRVDLKKLAEIK